MSEDYHHQKIDIVIPKRSVLYRRITARAKADGVPVEAVVDMLMSVGSNQLMKDRLDIMDGKKKGKK